MTYALSKLFALSLQRFQLALQTPSSHGGITLALFTLAAHGWGTIFGHFFRIGGASYFLVLGIDSLGVHSHPRAMAFIGLGSVCASIRRCLASTKEAPRGLSWVGVCGVKPPWFAFRGCVGKRLVLLRAPIEPTTTRLPAVIHTYVQ